MIKKILVFIILLIIFYDVYNTNLIIDSSDNSVDQKKNNIINKIKNAPSPSDTQTDYANKKINITSSNTSPNTSLNISPNPIISYNTFTNTTQNNTKHNVNDDYDEDLPPVVEVVNPKLYGNPSDYKEGKYIVWEFQDPNPWTKIIYKYNENYPFNFFIKLKIPSLNDYEDWKKIINNLDFDPRSGEIILPTNDEETALSIINLMITHFNGDISINDIVNKNLIDISINKAKKYEVVKNKIKEQIKQSTTIKTRESFKDLPKFEKDLAVTNTSLTNSNNINDYNPYEGTEYSFL